MHMNITSLWFLSNILRQIATGWIFQLNADATFGFCRNAVDMIGFGVNSVGAHNHPLCWSIIPHQTKGELNYTGTYAELEEAFILSCSIRTCDREDCTSCATLKQLRAQERVIKYLVAIPSRPARFQLILHSATTSWDSATSPARCLPWNPTCASVIP
jgi:hypothetical protein